PLVGPAPSVGFDCAEGAIACGGFPLRSCMVAGLFLAALVLACAAFALLPEATVFAPVATVIAPLASIAPAIPPPAAPIIAEVAGTIGRLNAGKTSTAMTNNTMPPTAPQNWSTISVARPSSLPKSVMG